MSQFLYVHDCAAAPVTTSAYIEIAAETTDTVSIIQFFYFKPDTSFGLVKMAIGDIGEEIDVVTCSQKVGTPINVYIPQGSRLSIQAIGSDVNSGSIIVCLLS